eukprot:gb/GEZJ01003087.1/.p1 GENE.gb/GEZJ01003087.1/~~gb/GEZJ01003087.1/.p1  ORF type:complete len:229 (-),score=30.53 gb/GEZJ01003087.1/:25-645(-)
MQAEKPYKIETVTVYAASGANVDKHYLDEAYKLGVAIANQGWVQVNGGGATGLMGAVTRGARHAKGIVDAVNLHAFVDQSLSKRYRNVNIAKTLPDRKAGLFERADAIVTLPGGLGTLDELAEQMCARQWELHLKPVVVLNTNGYYNPIRDFVRNGEESRFVAVGMSQAIRFVDTPEQVIHYLKNYTPIKVSKQSVNSSELNSLNK